MANAVSTLLDTLCERSDCAYMSDLTLSEKAHSIAKAAKELSLNDYSEVEWIKAAEYISSERMSFQSGASARNYLIHLK